MYQEQELFAPDYGKDESPVDNTQIKMTLLYFSEEEYKEYKRLSKSAMKKVWGKDYQTEGNLSDLMLTMLKKFNNEEISIEKKDIYRQGSLFENEIP